MKTIAFMAFKGGVGKSTSATNVAGVLAKKGKKVLLIDADFQGNGTLAFGFDPDTAEGYSLYELLHGEVTLEETIIHTDHENIDLIPTTLDLCAIEMDLLEDMWKPEKDRKWKNHLYVFKNLIEEIEQSKEYDYVIVDAGPSLSFFSSGIILATDIFMIPLQMGKFAYRGTKKFITEIKRIRGDKSDYQAFAFSTFYNNRNNVSIDILELAKQELPPLGVKLLETKIPKTVNYENAQSYYNKPLTLLEENGPNVGAYKNLIHETQLLNVKGEK